MFDYLSECFYSHCIEILFYMILLYLYIQHLKERVDNGLFITLVPFFFIITFFFVGLTSLGSLVNLDCLVH